jgi:Ulp1 family protease
MKQAQITENDFFQVYAHSRHKLFFFLEIFKAKRGAHYAPMWPEKRHARVKKWTKHVDLFEKDFIIVPINERYLFN